MFSWILLYLIFCEILRQKSVKISLFETIAIWHPVCNSDKNHKTRGMLVLYISNTLYLKKYDIHSSYLTSFRFAIL